MTEKKSLYVGCSLTFAPEHFTRNVEALKNRLSEKWHIMHFLGVTLGNEEDVYQRDIIENVGGCDAFLAVLDEPATALGYELKEANHLRKPVLAVAHTASKVSRLILGAPAFNPNMTFRRYDDLLEDVPQMVTEQFEPVLFS
jgi:hypothetical protein